MLYQVTLYIDVDRKVYDEPTAWAWSHADILQPDGREFLAVTAKPWKGAVPGTVPPTLPAKRLVENDYP